MIVNDFEPLETITGIRKLGEIVPFRYIPCIKIKDLYVADVAFVRPELEVKPNKFFTAGHYWRMTGMSSSVPLFSANDTDKEIFTKNEMITWTIEVQKAEPYFWANFPKFDTGACDIREYVLLIRDASYWVAEKKLNKKFEKDY